MDNHLPDGLMGEREMARRNMLRRRTRFRVMAGERSHGVMEFTADGFVIEADGRPQLRGFVDIVEGDRLVTRRLAICTWARDGLVGYEFKRDTDGGDVAPDHVPPVHIGLIEGPSRD